MASENQNITLANWEALFNKGGQILTPNVISRLIQAIQNETQKRSKRARATTNVANREG